MILFFALSALELWWNIAILFLTSPTFLLSTLIETSYLPSPFQNLHYSGRHSFLSTLLQYILTFHPLSDALSDVVVDPEAFNTSSSRIHFEPGDADISHIHFESGDGQGMQYGIPLCSSASSSSSPSPPIPFAVPYSNS